MGEESLSNARSKDGECIQVSVDRTFAKSPSFIHRLRGPLFLFSLGHLVREGIYELNIGLCIN